MRSFKKVALLAAVAGAIGIAQSGVFATEKAAAQSTLHKPDAVAMDALVKMSGYLQTVKQFSLDVDSTTDRIMVNGDTTQLIQLSHKTKLTVNRPDHLKADIVGDASGTSRHAYFNGKHFTLYTQPDNYYATVAAPATIKELTGALESRYGIELPLSDIFTLGSNPDDMKRVLSAAYLGDEVVGGVTCSHYAYHESAVDWQIWIQKGNQPLPCKLNIVTLTDKQRPQYTAVYHWNLNPEINQKTFEFSAPENARQIKFAQIANAQ
ncbi:DUF2092 domain-containing protein [Caballeronia sp. J97]|uniref:DUF2092 domain-containing protein n=1 Tax=Caballeronia sp. J97 TaxID=2805429 RepID=UPI002AB0C470|nr:DUF2092 domain-containing protein [Caballeronia sp. J97]